ncbi:MAG TPA: hypothetical protein DCQ26_15110 [Marinilabiliales bacterium]|nr:MAG: hypothetical protein A2W96_19130 [Bacteroidetes bacterium GWD2_40_43]OFX93517.1 MAG: hypothetical protein A2W97_14730 [Bacteroidetes bacterium GWE2_40_63]HAM99930.1 hypothetical protein [Marinilabiliales bacterium]HBX83942.1 hypothetical protein [Marinilabiliales bacterium]
MKKLFDYIQLETKKGFNIKTEFGPHDMPGIANYDIKCVVLNQRFINGEIKSFSENELIGVLYHEIGHLKYFEKHPVTKKNFTEEYKTKSEYYAFENTFNELLKIAIEGDCEPLRSTFAQVNDRIKSNFKKENNSKSHIIALMKISKSKIFLECDRFLNLDTTCD